ESACLRPSRLPAPRWICRAPRTTGSPYAETPPRRAAAAPAPNILRSFDSHHENGRLTPAGSKFKLYLRAPRWIFKHRGKPPAKTRAESGASLGRIRIFVDDVRLGVTHDHGLVDHNLGYSGHGRQFVHDIQQDVFQNGTQTTGASLTPHGTLRNGPQRIRAQFQFTVFHFEQPA